MVGLQLQWRFWAPVLSSTPSLWNLSHWLQMLPFICPCHRMLQGGSADSRDDGGPQFAEVFVIIWFGAVVITLNSKLLGGTMWVLVYLVVLKMLLLLELLHCLVWLLLPHFCLCSRSFFQSLCVLGYCVLPLTVAMLVCRLVLLVGSGTISFIIRLVVVIAMFGWSTLGE